MVARKKRSKKRSGASLKLHESPLVFFLDRSLGRNVIAEALRAAGAQVEIHDDHFNQGTTDDIWLTVAGQRGWVVITKDKRIRYNRLARFAITKAGVRSFILTAKNLRGDQMATLFVDALPAMARFANKHPAPFIAKITRGGFISMLKTDD